VPPTAANQPDLERLPLSRQGNATRRTEVLIGKLLGQVEERQHTDLLPTGDSDDRIPREDRHKFRFMAAHEEFVEELRTQPKSENHSQRKKPLAILGFPAYNGSSLKSYNHEPALMFTGET
jgi:hypothetical protein